MEARGEGEGNSMPLHSPQKARINEPPCTSPSFPLFHVARQLPIRASFTSGVTYYPELGASRRKYSVKFRRGNWSTRKSSFTGMGGGREGTRGLFLSGSSLEIDTAGESFFTLAR